MPVFVFSFFFLLFFPFLGRPLFFGLDRLTISNESNNVKTWQWSVLDNL